MHDTPQKTAGLERSGNPPPVRARIRRSRGRVAAVVATVAVVLVFLAVPALRFFARSNAEPDPVPPAPIVLATVIRGPAERVVRYPGNLVPETTTTVLPRVGGRIVALSVRENRQVSAGEVIARIEDEVLRIQAEQARAAYQGADAMYRQAVRGAREQEIEIARSSVAQAEASLETARANLERTRRLYDAGTVARSTFEEAEDRFAAAQTEVQNARRTVELYEIGAGDEELAMARSQVDAAARQLELAELQLSYARVTAPIAGTVARVHAEVGQTVGTQSPIVSLVNDRLIYARIGVPELLYGRFRGREGAVEVRVLPVAYPGESFAGTVSSVAPVIDAASRTFQVEVAVLNADGRLRPGMFVTAEFVIESTPDALLVPDRAVFARNGAQVVFVVRDGRAAAVSVTAVDLPGPLTHVTAGLDGVDEVIGEGAAFLADGAPVRVVDAR